MPVIATPGRAGGIDFYNTVLMRRSSARAFAFAIGGGLLFAGALVYFLVAYVVWFDALAAPASRPRDIAIDVALFSGFALHHSVFARTGARTWLQRVAAPELERSIYVWIASLLFLGVCYFWRPVAGEIWTSHGTVRVLLYALQGTGVVLTLGAARRLDVLELAGVRQVQRAQARQHEPPRLDQTGPYRAVRHPIYAAWLLLVWAAPTMNGTRLVFAAVSTAYLLVAIQFEERDLRRAFGPAYDAYRARVRWRLVPYVY
jgi:protein-S-isoprenylcysteine O-methyltransferase Ste14